MREAGDEIAAIIANADSLDEVNAELEKWTHTTEIFERMGDVIFVTTVLADMAGQLMVAGREAEVVQLSLQHVDHADHAVAMAAGDPVRPPPPPSPKPFLDLPWEDAINAFKKRGLVKATDFETLLKSYAQRSAVARQLMLDQVQSEVMRHLTDAIEKGETFPEFAGKVDAMSESLGLAPGAPSYLSCVFRTNVQSAYGAGKYKAIKNPIVMQSRPFVQYRTVGDARVREEHAVLDGLTFRTDDPTWERIAPPNGFQCRCSVVTLSKAEAANTEISTEIPEDYIPTPGFDQPPTAMLDVSETQEPTQAPPPKSVPPRTAPPPRATPVPAPTPAPPPRAAPAPKPAPPKPAPAPPRVTPVPAPTPPTPPRAAPAPKPAPPAPPPPSPIVAPSAAPSPRLGKTAEQVFDKKLTDAELDGLAGTTAKLPSGLTVETKVQENARKGGAGDVRLTGAIKNDKGDVVGNFTRTFEREGDKLNVRHGFFGIDEKYQNTGIGKQLFNAQVDAYKQQGVSRVDLDAEDIGRYVWAKAGFEWADKKQGKEVIAQLRDHLAQKFGDATAARLIKPIRTPQDIAQLRVGDERVGKQFLLDYEDIIGMWQTPAKITRL